MSVSVRIPAPLRPFTNHLGVVLVDGSTVGEVLKRLTTVHAELRPHLFAADGLLRSFVNVYVNDDDIRYLRRQDTPVGPKDEVSIVPSVAGGVDVADHEADALPQALPSAAAETALTRDEISRYSRHLIMPEVGLAGQQRLKAARVLLVGAGGLGSPAALYLAAAGVGTIGLVDFDAVDASNLQRQILYGVRDIGRPKLAAAADRLADLNPSVRIVTHDTRLSSGNALDIFRSYDVIVDGADNFPTRYLVNDACVLLGKPNAYGSIFRFDGQASVFATRGGPCYRCLYREPPPAGLVPSCAEGGVLGVLPGLVGVIQATEAIKIILGAGRTLAGRLLLVDAWSMEFRTLALRRDPACPACGDRPTMSSLIDYEQFCGVAPVRPGDGDRLPDELELSVEELRARLEGRDRVWILDVREPAEYEICRLPGSTLIPLADLPRRLDDVPIGSGAPEVVVHCKAGVRSAKAVRLLRSHGHTRVRSLTGGILAWIARVDPTLNRY